MFKKINYVLDRRQKIQLFILLIVIFLGAFVELLGVSAILPVINIALAPETVDEKWYAVIIKNVTGAETASQVLVIMAIILIIIYILKNIYVTLMNGLQYRFIFENQRILGMKLMDCYMHQKYLFHVSKNVAELQRNVTSDVNGFYTVVLYVLQFLAEISVCIVLTLYLMTQDIMTTLMLAAFLVVFLGFFTGFFKKVLVKKGEKNRVLNAEVSKWILQSFSGIKEIKVTNAEKFFLDNYADSYKKCARIQLEQSMLTYIPKPTMETVCISGLLLTMIVKIVVTKADITSFVTTLSIFAVAAMRMLPSFNRITGYIGGMMFNKPSIYAVYTDLLEIEELMKNTERHGDLSKSLELNSSINFENLTFSYPETDKKVLDSVNLTIKKNSSVAFIGSSGAGKTTAADVLLGLLEPQSGKVTIDGIDIQENMQAWHNCIGYIPQTIYLMDDSIKANITFGISKEQIDDDRINQVLKEAQLDEFVKSLPEGLDTMVGDRGVRLSGGQRQRIGIARALYRNPQVLILDEATSALDNETEKEVMQAIDGLHGTRTLIVIAHRLSTIAKCDRIYEVGEGKITERNKEDVLGGK
jgi:ABC-type multidrug transport system fused ATPase/permease subunit